MKRINGNSLDKNEIERLEDQDLKLRYYLGGLYGLKKDYQCNYWSCDINCSCSPVPDDEDLVKVKKVINQHNLTNEDFLRLAYSYVVGGIMKYKGSYSPLFIEFDIVLSPYNFEDNYYKEIPDNDLREKELNSILNDSIVLNFCDKYRLTKIDFLALAKTSINYGFLKMRGLNNFENKFGQELTDIIKEYDLYLPLEYVKEYRDEYKRYHEETELFFEIKSAQKHYLELMKSLIVKQPDLATQMISEELNELGFNSKRDIKKLVLNKSKNTNIR